MASPTSFARSDFGARDLSPVKLIDFAGSIQIVTDCAACHKPPKNHFPGQCSECHNTESWKGASFNHTFPIDHKSAKGNCAACHPGGDTATWTCAGCHEPAKMDKKHEKVPDYSGNCLACHADGKKPKK